MMYADVLGQICPIATAKSVLEYCVDFFLWWDETSLTSHALKQDEEA